jgi:hypothetical protein
MKIHSNILSEVHVMNAARKARDNGADIDVYDLSSHGSRKRNSRIDFYAKSENGKHASAHGGWGGSGNTTVRAASWSDYGYLMAELFRIDPNAIIGQYDGLDSFKDRCRSEWLRRRNMGDPCDIGFLNV